jgi:hypothetical protein
MYNTRGSVTVLSFQVAQRVAPPILQVNDGAAPLEDYMDEEYDEDDADWLLEDAIAMEMEAANPLLD